MFILIAQVIIQLVRLLTKTMMYNYVIHKLTITIITIIIVPMFILMRYMTLYGNTFVLNQYSTSEVKMI